MRSRLESLFTRIELYENTDNAIIRDVIFIISSVAAFSVFLNLYFTKLDEASQVSDVPFISVSITQFVFSLSIILEMMGLIKNKEKGFSRILIIFQILFATCICGISIFVTSLDNSIFSIDLRSILLIINSVFIVLIATVFLFDITISCIFLTNKSYYKPENSII
jgi:hypothetical protein